MSKFQIRETRAGEMAQARGGHPIAWNLNRDTAESALDEIESIWLSIADQSREQAAARFNTGRSTVYEVERDGDTLDVMRVEVDNDNRDHGLGYERQRTHHKRFEVEADGGVPDHGPGKPPALETALSRISV